MANPCEKCGDLTSNAENEFCEFICDECEQNAAEAAWERYCENFHGGSGFLSIREQQIEARKLK